MPLPVPIKEFDATPLDAKWHRFAEEYTVDFNVTRAAERAGVNPVSARNAMNDPRVVAVIRECQRRLSDGVKVSVSQVLDLLSMIVRSNIMDYFETVESAFGKRTLLKLHDLTIEQQLAIKSIKWTEKGPQIELFDKVAAANQIGRFFGIWTDGVKVTGVGTGAPALIENGMTDQEAAELYQRTVKPE
jgi:hypothetical protein